MFGLAIYKVIWATKDSGCEYTANILKCVSVYKYLGIIEDSRGIPTRISFEEVQSKLISRVERPYDAVLAVLIKNKIHLRPGCKEHLYLPKKELGRDLHSNNNKTHLALIKGFLKVKYRLVEEVTKKSLEEAQLVKLYNKIEKRKLLSKLYNARKNELVSVVTLQDG
ncbi:hypothetical protein CWI39_1078p0010 [Hamiltosporidium magnivora]|uniref:Uncharacterized protein n=1 Tax=Hamiltosporidium magnivora TaxID=148818 RepID=A0A4Q9L5H9_9MICR|nr:hypothetical protein CWI39_1078p0010 [Hamiltosporidium magnivora]